MPELFCGFPQDAGRRAGPVPRGLRPQAWAAASVSSSSKRASGLEISAPQAGISFIRPQLPASLGELRIHNLKLAGATVDLLLVRHADDVGVNVLRREGDVQIVVVK